jgi:hypothetical protein
MRDLDRPQTTSDQADRRRSVAERETAPRRKNRGPLARSAQNRPGDPAPSRDAVSNFRGVAAIVAQSQLSNKSPMAWAMLIDQLGRTLRTIGEAHVARGETETARALVDNLSRELEVLHDRFETSSPHELIPGERMADERNPRASPADEIPQSGHEIAKTHVARHRGRGSSHGRGFGR